jgi:hypothetical protein
VVTLLPLLWLDSLLLWVEFDLGDVLVVLLFEFDVGLRDELDAHLLLGLGEGGHVDLDALHICVKYYNGYYLMTIIGISRLWPVSPCVLDPSRCKRSGRAVRKESGCRYSFGPYA